MRRYPALQAIAALSLLIACNRPQTSTAEVDLLSDDPRTLRGNVCFDKGQPPQRAVICNGIYGTFVVGLADQHHWTRGTRITIQQDDELTGPRAVAVAWVVEELENAAKIRVIIQEPGTNLVGATASPIRSDQYPRFKNFYAHLVARSGDRLSLDLGGNDDVRVGDVYEARDPFHPDYPVGRVSVTKVHDMHSEAEIVSEDTVNSPIGARHEFVLSTAQDGASLASVTVGIVTTKASGPSKVPPLSLPAGQTARQALQQAKAFAKTFALGIEQLEAEPGTSTAQLARLADLARSRGMDQLVWASGPCGGDTRAQLCHAVVPKDPGQPLAPEALLLPSSGGGPEVGGPLATLGQIAFSAEMFDEASYHLRSWVGKASADVAPGVMIQLAEAEFALGQLERSRMWLAQVREHAGNGLKRRNMLPFLRAWSNIACREANPQEIERIERQVEKAKDGDPEYGRVRLKVLECGVQASLKARDYAAASRQIAQGLELGRELGDQAWVNHFEAFHAQVLESTGELGGARQILMKAYENAKKSGDRRSQAQLGLALARNHIRDGDFSLGKQHALEALGLYKELRDEDGIVDCVPIVVLALRRVEGTQYTRQFLMNEQQAWKRSKLKRVVLALQIAQADLLLQSGDMKTAGGILKDLRERVRRHQFIDEEVQVLGMSAELLIITGPTQRTARSIELYWNHAVKRDQELHQAHARLLLAKFRLQEGTLELARQSAGKAGEHYKALEDRAGGAEVALVLADIERESGDIAGARLRYGESQQGFGEVKDREGAKLAELGLAALDLWQGQFANAHQKLSAIAEQFKISGNAFGELRARLLLEWANYMQWRDSPAALKSLRGLRETAKRRNYVVLQAEAQMLIACVHRLDSDFKSLAPELKLAQGLYSDMGRLEQPLPCKVFGETLTTSAERYGAP